MTLNNFPGVCSELPPNSNRTGRITLLYVLHQVVQRRINRVDGRLCTHKERVSVCVLDLYCFGPLGVHGIPVKLVFQNVSVFVALGFRLVAAPICRYV